MHATAPQRAVAVVPSTVTSSAVDAGGVDGEGGAGIGGAGGAGSKASAAAGDASAPKDAGDPNGGGRRLFRKGRGHAAEHGRGRRREVLGRRHVAVDARPVELLLWWRAEHGRRILRGVERRRRGWLLRRRAERRGCVGWWCAKGPGCPVPPAGAAAPNCAAAPTRRNAERRRRRLLLWRRAERRGCVARRRRAEHGRGRWPGAGANAAAAAGGAPNAAAGCSSAGAGNSVWSSAGSSSGAPKASAAAVGGASNAAAASVGGAPKACSRGGAEGGRGGVGRRGRTRPRPALRARAGRRRRVERTSCLAVPRRPRRREVARQMQPQPRPEGRQTPPPRTVLRRRRERGGRVGRGAPNAPAASPGCSAAGAKVNSVCSSTGWSSGAGRTPRRPRAVALRTPRRRQ